MGEERFTNIGGVEDFVHTIFDNDSAKTLSMKQVVALLNSLYDENEQLRQQLKEKQEEERLYANEILELRKINEEFIQFKELGGDY